MLLGLEGGGRPLKSYEGFKHETKFIKAELGFCRDTVRTGYRYGWSRCVSRSAGVARFEVNSAGDCGSPVVFNLRSVQMEMLGVRFPRGVRAYLVSIARRCRQCEWCKLMRSYHWSERATTEYFKYPNTTWLMTFTLSPFERARLDARVALKAQKSGAYHLTEWSAGDLFRERCELFGKEISLWLKRCRVAEQRRRAEGSMLGEFRRGVPSGDTTETPTRATAAAFSYLLVAEKHQDGWPHWHMLLHEHAASELIRLEEYYVTARGKVRVADAAMVRKQWLLGFTQGELCTDHRSAGYLCKYLAKDMPWRVRASLGYGEQQTEVGDFGRGSDEATERTGLDAAERGARSEARAGLTGPLSTQLPKGAPLLPLSPLGGRHG